MGVKSKITLSEAGAVTETSDRAEYTFDLSGGLLCLDFVNTVSGSRARPTERLHSHRDLLSWARQARVVAEDEIGRLAREAQRRPGDAARALDDALGLREALFRIFTARIELRANDRADLHLLNAWLSRALAHQRIAETPDGFAWTWDDHGGALERIVWPVIRSAADLLTSPDLRRVRRCAGPTCDWLFMDTSRNHTRRWCDMDSCGNRAKARRYYERHRAHANTPESAD